MALLSVSNLEKAFGVDVIFSGVSFEIQENDRIGFVGINGSGKTALFKALTGDQPADNGEIHLSNAAVLGYMEQHVCSDRERSAYSEVLSVFSPLLSMEKEIEELSLRIQAGADGMDALIERQTMLSDRFAIEGGLTCRSRARSALLGLGFSDDQMGLPVGVLSGGQKAKLQLAKLLLSGANLLLLDEPTNHLDIGSCEALEEALRRYEGTLLIVSHDRYLMNKLADRIYYLDSAGAKPYSGNYDAFLEKQKSEQLTVQATAVKEKGGEYKQQKEKQAAIRREKAAVRRLEQEIAETEAEIFTLESSLSAPDIASDYQKITELSEQLQALRQKNDALFTEWSTRTEQLETTHSLGSL